MTASIDFIFDVGSPNVYLAHKCIPEIEKRTDVKFNYIPCLIGGIFKATGNQPPIISMAKVQGRFEYERIEFMRFIKKHKLFKFKMNSNFPVNTLLVQRGALVAEARGELTSYVDAALKAVWEDDVKLDNAEAISKTMNDADLDGEAIIAEMQKDEIKAKLISNTDDALARGCFGMPTFYFGDEMYFGKNTLPEIEEEVLKQMG